jgi:5'-3' exonuclease, N-terminal resolvase-like domain
MTKLRLIDGLNILRRRFENLPPEDALREILHYGNLYKGDTIVWCWDCPRAVAVRRAVYPDYKLHRTPPKLDGFYEMAEFVKDLLKYTSVYQVQVPEREADDVIASLSQSYSGPVHIHSNDGDLTQLLVKPNVTTDATFKVHPQFVRLFKTCVGDSSDNIKGIPGLGEGTWDDLDRQQVLLEFTKIVTRRISGTALSPKDEERLASFGVARKSITFIREELERLQILYTIVGFLPTPRALIDQHTVAGHADPLWIDLELRKFYL